MKLHLPGCQRRFSVLIGSPIPRSTLGRLPVGALRAGRAALHPGGGGGGGSKSWPAERPGWHDLELVNQAASGNLASQFVSPSIGRLACPPATWRRALAGSQVTGSCCCSSNCYSTVGSGTGAVIIGPRVVGRLASCCARVGQPGRLGTRAGWPECAATSRNRAQKQQAARLSHHNRRRARRPGEPGRSLGGHPFAAARWPLAGRCEWSVGHGAQSYWRPLCLRNEALRLAGRPAERGQLCAGDRLRGACCFWPPKVAPAGRLARLLPLRTPERDPSGALSPLID